MLSSLSSFEEDQFGPQGMLSEGNAAAALAPSAELRALCHLQLSMLITLLESRLGPAAAETAVRCAVYRRSPVSFSSGQLQLQLVAASDAREAEAASTRQDLILGLPGANEQYQEAWLVEQNLIVLPDSGGLVLPLAHNSFLVGLLVVECCCAEGFPIASLAGSLHPPACAVFSPGDMALIKQTGTAVGLACALDLRAALERAGHAVRQKQVQGIVRQVRKPLSTLRTLGAMLAPRLQEGEPERDMTDSILAQGQRIGDLVGQLQALLAPTVPAVRLGGPLANESAPPLPQPITLPSRFRTTNAAAKGEGNSPNGGGGGGSSSLASFDTIEGITAHPALPSSTIGADYWGPVQSREQSTGEESNDTSTSSAAAAAASVDDISSAFGTASIPPAALIATLTPLLSSAEKFASVSGVTFLLPLEQRQLQQQHHSQQQPSFLTKTSGYEWYAERLAFPETGVAVEPVLLKRLLTQILDGTIACAARGDCIELLLEAETWQGRPGVVIATRLVQAIGPGALTRGVAHAIDTDGHVFIAEFAILSQLARQCGGWFDVRAEAHSSAAGGTQQDRTLAAALADGGGTLVAAIWLPCAPNLDLN